MNLEDLEKASSTRVAVVGLSGTGKSTLVSNLVRGGFNLKWIDLDGDSDIVLKLPRQYWPQVDFIQIPDSATFPVGCDTLLKLFKSGEAKICVTHGVVDCQLCKARKEEAKWNYINLKTLDNSKDIVVLDTGSQLGHSILAHALKDKSVDYKPERDDWGILRRWSEFFYSQFRAAKFNFVVTFHAIEAEMEDGRKKLVPSFGSRDMSSKIAGAFSHVVYCDVMNKKHKAFSASTYSNNVLTKSRSDICLENLAEPSLIPIFSGDIPATENPAHKIPTVDNSVEAKNKVRESLAKLQAKVGPK